MERRTRRSLLAVVVGLWGMYEVDRTPSFGDETTQLGSIVGQLADSQGQAYRVGNAVVFLCNAETGMPFSQKTKQPIELGAESMFDFSSFLHAVTDDNGAFEFRNVHEGNYRIVAQAWSGISGMPRGLPGSHRDDPGQEPSSTIILHGVVEDVRVTPGVVTRAYPRQRGSSTVRIVTDPAEPHNYLLLSMNPRLGEGILGPLGWGKEFIAGVVGLTRMEDSHVTIIGLAEDDKIHTGLWNYDNLAGTGGNTFVAGKEEPVRLPIYAYWSNGKYEPTPRLAKLTDHIEQNNVDVEQLVDLGEPALSRDYFDLVWSRAHELIDISGYGQASSIDLLAADSYRQSRKFHLERKKRQAERRAKQK